MTRTRLAALLAALLLSAAGCSDADESAGPLPVRTAVDGTTFNDADAAYAAEMVRLHADAFVLVDEATAEGLSPEVLALGEQIREGRAPEVEQFVVFLGAWGEEVPETARDHVNAGHPGDSGHGDGDSHDHGGEGSAETPAPAGGELTAADRAWLEKMAAHHEKALEAARTEVADGTHADTVALAEHAVATHEAELAQIRELLG